ncbi:hypothetical protein BURPS1106B_A2178 [Burkholderia pseudomallei 1106b]|uniref:Uncharacterized protein n=1 Tax=Burkholderia pseudomallei (strain 1106a) TaxID=357348 RepID=A3NXY4_BURP0|nr:hypothetical protein BURPS1106A_2961 [Burkholderia pseudomallei 1106a]EES25366.1 hypothetical protein BURPS1106B_A2178 [Burkholderia pseudomallei 1106b]
MRVAFDSNHLCNSVSYCDHHSIDLLLTHINISRSVCALYES